jgi:hypothetical protein
MSGSIEHNAAIKIQFVFKLNNCIKCLEEFNKLNLKTLASTKSFLEFQKFITNKNTSPNMINTINKFIFSLNKFKNGLTIKAKFIVTAYIINYFPDWYKRDNMCYKWEHEWFHTNYWKSRNIHLNVIGIDALFKRANGFCFNSSDII